MIQIGDFVAVIDENTEGQVISVEKQKITLKTTDGFVFSYDIHKIVKIKKDEITLNVPNVSAFLNEKDPKKQKKQPKQPKKDRFSPALEVDLHIEQLVENPRGMTNYEMLNKQLNMARFQLEFAIQKGIQRVIFIHGVGEGVLKAELEMLLSRYSGVTYQDGDYTKYGQGATEIYIPQSVRLDEY